MAQRYACMTYSSPPQVVSEHPTQGAATLAAKGRYQVRLIDDCPACGATMFPPAESTCYLCRTY